MIFIAAEKPSVRLVYICDVIFNRILRTPHKVIQLEEIRESVAKFPAASLLYYTSENKFGPGSNVIPNEGLLEEDFIKKQAVTYKEEGGFLQVLFSESKFPGFLFGFDLFSASFFLLTEYEKYTDPIFDTHGRYDEESYFIYKKHYHRLPLIHIYAEELWKHLLKTNPILRRDYNYFDYSITMDVDSPFLYKGKPGWVNFGGFIKDVLSFNFNCAGDRISTLFGNAPDPYDVFDYTLTKVDPKKLIFFWLIDRNSAHDGRHTYKDKIYRDLIKRMKENQIRQGLHPSYTSFLDKMRIVHEKQHLELMLGGMVEKARMHFLKYRLPETYRYLIEAGIKADYTSCTYRKPGFKNFIAVPFPWFDLEKNTITPLILHPTMVMDRTLQKYMAQDPEASFEVLKDYIDITHRYNGHFIFLLHNNTLSEKAEWKGWRPVFEKTIQYLQQRTPQTTI